MWLQRHHLMALSLAGGFVCGLVGGVIGWLTYAENDQEV